MTDIPEWVKMELNRLYRDGGSKWTPIRQNLKPITEFLGYELSKKQVYDILFPNEGIAPCGKNKRFVRFDLGYAYCGIGNAMCSCKLAAKTDNTRKTNNQKYGVDNIFQSVEIKEKIKSTNLKKYGVEIAMKSDVVKQKQREAIFDRYGVYNPSQCQEIRNKVIRTNREKWGVDFPLLNEEISQKSHDTNLLKYGTKNPSKLFRKKARKTNLSRYGFDHALKNPEIRAKMEEHNLNKYGVKSTFELDSVKELIRKTNIDRYGSEYATKNEQVKARIRDTNLLRYNAVNPMQNNEIKNKSRITNFTRYDRTSHTQLHISKSSLSILQDSGLLQAEFEGKSISTISKELGIDQTTFSRYWYGHGLPSLENKSSYEIEIAYFLKSLGVDFVINEKKILNGRHLDFYIPSHRLAIEFNGSFHHSTLRKSDSLYHRQKYLGCREQNVRLIMIPQDSWDIRMQAVKAIIKDAIFGKSHEISDDVTFDIIENDDANEFAYFNHVLGAELDPVVSIGAKRGESLIGVMIFKNNNTAIELSRFCYNAPINLIAMFNSSVSILKLTKVVSYVDLRFSNGDELRDLGFEYITDKLPDFRLFLGNMTYDKTEITDVSEIETAPRIYDCGWLEYIWHSKTDV